MTTQNQTIVKRHAICIMKDEGGYSIYHRFYPPYGTDTSLVRPTDVGHVQFSEAVDSLWNLPNKFYVEGVDIEFALSPSEVPQVPEIERNAFKNLIGNLEKLAVEISEIVKIKITNKDNRCPGLERNCEGASPEQIKTRCETENYRGCNLHYLFLDKPQRQPVVEEAQVGIRLLN